MSQPEPEWRECAICGSTELTDPVYTRCSSGDPHHVLTAHRGCLLKHFKRELKKNDGGAAWKSVEGCVIRPRRRERSVSGLMRD